MISALIFSVAALAASHGGPTSPAAGDFTFDITVQADQLIDCSVFGTGNTPSAFAAAGLTDVENVVGVTFGSVGPTGNLYRWYDGLSNWYVGGEADLTCNAVAGLSTVAVSASAVGVGGADGFFNAGIADLNLGAPSDILIDGAGPSLVVPATPVPFSNPIMLGALIDNTDAAAAQATITFTFAPA